MAPYTVVGKAVEVYYRLDTYVDRASDQGAVPQAIVSAALARDDPDAVVLPGIEVDFPGGAKSEIDIVAVTSPAEFDDEQLDRDLRKTSLRGVFAAGDIRYGSVKRVAGAVGEGSVAVGSVHQYLTALAASSER